MIDFNDYEKKKLAGAVTVVPLNDGYAVSFKQFDPDTGAALADNIVGVNGVELSQLRQSLQNQINQIDSFVADSKLNIVTATTTTVV